MATTIKLEGEARSEFGKGVARRLRVANKIPATIYAGGEEPAFVTLPMRETTLALRHTNALFTIAFDGNTKMAVVKDVQKNPVKRIIEHVDFLEVKAGEKIDVEVPVFVEGTPKGAAVAFVDLQELKVRADVTNLPERIVVNVDGLTDGTKDPGKVEQQLRAILPPEESNDFCHRLVLHGRAVCIARRPQCQSCVLRPWCDHFAKSGQTARGTEGREPA